MGGAFPGKGRERKSSPVKPCPSAPIPSLCLAVPKEVPDVVATELRVEAVTVELLLRLRPRLLTLLRLDETLTTGGAADTVLEEVEKVLAEEWRLASLSTLVC